MRSEFLSYVKQSLIFTVFVVLLALGIFALIHAEYYTPVFPFMVLFFLSVSLTGHYFLFKALHKRPAKFVHRFMLITTGKLFIFLLVMVSYALVFRQDAARFIITFFILYVLYTTFEIFSILRLSRKTEREKQRKRSVK